MVAVSSVRQVISVASVLWFTKEGNTEFQDEK